MPLFRIPGYGIAATGDNSQFLAVIANDVITNDGVTNGLALGQYSGHRRAQWSPSDNAFTFFDASDGRAAMLVQSLKLAGGQIAFPATQIASSDPNTLDDYERGAWTGTLAPSSSGSITLNSSFNRGRYVKFGSAVFMTGEFVVSAVSSPVGNLALGGLPFAPAAGEPFNSAGSVATIGLSSSVSAPIQALMNGSPLLQLFKFSSGTIAAMGGDVIVGTIFYVSALYFTS